MTDFPLALNRANEELRPVAANKPKNLARKDREDLLGRYSLDDLVRHFGRWPTYYLLLRHMSSGKPGRLVLGASVAGLLVSVALAYLKH
ncbi:MAG TPA: hypothetical protein VGO01_17830 [Bradyrhizobium sp.]|jgi:hypothetical protein|nr:hypothetical protein [Bradyrhizobium sp.]